MAVVLFDTAERKKLYPLTYTRAVADLRIGILTLREWWEKLLGEKVYVQTEEYLAPLYEEIPVGEHVWIDANVLPGAEIVKQIQALGPNGSIADDKGMIAYRRSSVIERPVQAENARRLEYPWHVFQWNDEVFRLQFELSRNNVLQPAETIDGSQLVNAEDIIIEEGATIRHSILNASTGPIYIGKDVTIMEGCLIQGPFAAGEGSVLKMGTRVYGATTLGPKCVLGGEVKNSVLTGYSNKAHDGYLGDSVIGEWCNLGAGTTNSNVKNTAGEINAWDFTMQESHCVGRKAGVIMGDYSRTAINSSINTGSIYGICCNIFGSNLLPRMLENFSWGTTEKTRYDIEKALRDINNWMAFKNHSLTEHQTQVLRYIFANFTK